MSKEDLFAARWERHTPTHEFFHAWGLSQTTLERASL